MSYSRDDSDVIRFIFCFVARQVSAAKHNYTNLPHNLGKCRYIQPFDNFHIVR